MSERIHRTGRRRHILTDRMRTLATDALAQKVGYLRVEDFPGSSIFTALPRYEYKPNRVIRAKNALYLVSGGGVQIRHSHHDYLVKELTPGAFFGEMTMLGQTMLATEAVAGAEGALISVMDAETTAEWVKANSVAILKKIGSRLALVEAEHYRSNFQLTDSRIAALLLELAGEESTVVGLSHERIGRRLGLYRETVTNILDAMKMDRLIEISRKKIRILDKRALQELSSL